MNLFFWGITISMVGKVLLATGVLMAHSQIAHEHRIDARVLRTFKTERTITFLGLLLIVIGYCLEVTFFGGFGHLFSCTGAECTAAIGSAFSGE